MKLIQLGTFRTEVFTLSKIGLLNIFSDKKMALWDPVAAGNAAQYLRLS